MKELDCISEVDCVQIGLFQKVMLRESTEPKLNTRVLWILFVHHSVMKVNSINIFSSGMMSEPNIVQI